MHAIEYNDTIILLECGTMFGESTTPGINTVMPNIQYLKDRKRQVRALVVTDPSMKHIGAIPYVMSAIGNPTIYTRPLTGAIIRNYQKKTAYRSAPVRIHEVTESATVPISDTVRLHFFGVTDSSPASLGVLIETGSGCVAYTGNIKIRHNDGSVPASEKKLFAPLKNRRVVLSLSDSVNAECPGFARADEEVADRAVKIIGEAPTRTFFPMIPSQVKRNSMILEGALKLGKKIYIQGASLFDTLGAARDLGILSVPKEALIPIQETEPEDDPSSVFVALTSAENETYQSLENMALDNYQHASTVKGDTIIFPSPMIPTSAQATQNLKDRLSRMGATIRSYDTSDARGGSHAGKDELRWMHQQINAKHFIPVQGYHYMLAAHTHILRDLGVSGDSLVMPENGSIIDISSDGMTLKKQKQVMPNIPVSVDGHTPLPVQEVVIQDRKTLSQEGIFIVVVFFDQKKLTLRKTPDIISRGFIYLRESRDLVTRARAVVKKAAEAAAKTAGTIDIDSIKKSTQKETQNFLMKETNKRPIIVPVVFT